MDIFLIDIKWFLISLFIGLFLVYTTTPTPKIIVKYPSVDKDEIFRDDVDNCYKFTQEEVKCPKDPKMIHKIPIITNEEE